MERLMDLATLELAGLREDKRIVELLQYAQLTGDRQWTEALKRLVLPRLAQVTASHPFIPSPASDMLPVGEIQVGNLVWGNGERGPEIALPLHEMASHLLVTGTTGTGKSVFLAWLATQLDALGVQVIMIDTEGDYAKRLWPVFGERLLVLTERTFRRNPFEPLAALDPLQHGEGPVEMMGRNRSVFSEAGWFGEGSRNLFGEALMLACLERGVLQGSTSYPTVHDVLRRAEELKVRAGSRQADYKDSVVNRLRGVVDMLRTYDCVRAGDFSISNLLRSRRPIVLSLIDLREEEMLLNLVVKDFLRAIATTMKRSSTGATRTVVCIDEAHRYATATEREYAPMLNVLAATSRKLGLGLVLATQTPSEIPKQLASVMSARLSFRLVDGFSAAAVATSMSLSHDRRDYLTVLPPRQAVLHYKDVPPFMLEVPELDLPIEEPPAEQLERALGLFRFVASPSRTVVGGGIVDGRQQRLALGDVVDGDAIARDDVPDDVKDGSDDVGDGVGNKLDSEEFTDINAIRAKIQGHCQAFANAGDDIGDDVVVDLVVNGDVDVDDVTTTSGSAVMTFPTPMTTLSKLEMDYLDDVGRYALTPATKRKVAGIALAKGTAVRASLVEKGLLEPVRVLTGERGGTVLLTELTKLGIQVLEQLNCRVSPAAGRGSISHRWYQALAADHYQRLGWKATIEGGVERADVLLEGAGRRVAVEIAVNAKHEGVNAVVDLERCDELWVVGVEESVLMAAERRVRSALGESDNEKVRFMFLSEMVRDMEGPLGTPRPRGVGGVGRGRASTREGPGEKREKGRQGERKIQRMRNEPRNGNDETVVGYVEQALRIVDDAIELSRSPLVRAPRIQAIAAERFAGRTNPGGLALQTFIRETAERLTADHPGSRTVAFLRAYVKGGIVASAAAAVGVTREHASRVFKRDAARMVASELVK